MTGLPLAPAKDRPETSVVSPVLMSSCSNVAPGNDASAAGRPIGRLRFLSHHADLPLPAKPMNVVASPMSSHRQTSCGDVPVSVEI